MRILFLIICSLLFSIPKANCENFFLPQKDSIPSLNMMDSSFSSKKCELNHKKTNIWSIIIPSTMVVYGYASLGIPALQEFDVDIRNEVQKCEPTHTSLDNFTQFAPAVATFGLKLFKVESKSNWVDMTVQYALSNILETGVVYVTKISAGRERPDESNNKSFPSGHTATAFVAAEFLHQEYGDKSIWYSIGGYTVAGLTGIGRITNNKHWFSDVVAGAGIGILSTKAVYWSYPYLKSLFTKKDKDGKEDNSTQMLIFPGYNEGAYTVNLSYSF